MSSLSDPEIEELKELVQKDIEIGDETRRMVYQMRRSARVGVFFQVLYWLVILGVLGASYYYVQPYMNRIFEVYQSIQHNSSQSQNFLENLQQSLGKLIPPQASSTKQ